MSESSANDRGAAVRATAAKLIAPVLAGRSSLSERHIQGAIGDLPHRDHGILKAFCYGTLRWQPQLHFFLSQLLDRPLKGCDRDIEALLLIGLFQLKHSGVSPHAAVSETVEASRALNKSWAASLVNAVLRRFLREQSTMAAGCNAADVCLYAHPEWLLELLRESWPENWAEIVAANNRQPPMWLRVNARRKTAARYISELAGSGDFQARAGNLSAEAVIIEPAADVARLPGFAAGDVSVQDAAAQLAPMLLEAQSGMRVLDACAAPGGKTCHLLEVCPGLSELVAVEKDPDRTERLRDNLNRLMLDATLVTADATDTAEWWDGEQFDRILLDVPCSATGVIRRHPDIKLTRRPTDIPGLAARQAALLKALWPLLAPGGRMLYVSCSVLKDENSRVLEDFVESAGDARVCDRTKKLLHAGTGRAAGPGVQILPGEADMDGFYYACLSKDPES